MPTSEEHIKRVKRKAFERDFYSGCSQSVLGALQEKFRVGNKESFNRDYIRQTNVLHNLLVD